MNPSYIPLNLRSQVIERAKELCEYCLIPQSFSFFTHEMDHIIAQKHGGQTISKNLAFSCSLCNKYKGSDIASIDPQTGSITPLFNPRRDIWDNHFEWQASGYIYPLTPKGRATARLLQFNRFDRIEERKLLILLGV